MLNSFKYAQFCTYTSVDSYEAVPTAQVCYQTWVEIEDCSGLDSDAYDR